MPIHIEGKLLRALGGLATPADKAHRKHFAYVSVRPDAVRDVSFVEVQTQQCWILVEQPEAADDHVLIERDECQRILPKDTIVVDGMRMTRPHIVGLEPPDGTGPDKVEFPDTGDMRVDSARRVAFCFDPRAMADLCKAIHAAGVSSCELLLPAYRGGPIAFRGFAAHDERLKVEAAFLPRDMFGESAESAGGEESDTLTREVVRAAAKALKDVGATVHVEGDEDEGSLFGDGIHE